MEDLQYLKAGIELWFASQELKALECEMNAMIYENEQRKVSGDSMAYHDKDFHKLAERIRAINPEIKT